MMLKTFKGVLILGYAQGVRILVLSFNGQKARFVEGRFSMPRISAKDCWPLVM